MKPAYPIIILALTAIGCNSSDKNATEITEDISTSQEVVDYTDHGHAPRSTMHIDSLANEADFLSPGEGVGVLIAYVEVKSEAEKAGKIKEAYETMRKFVDLYNIVSNNHKNDFKKAVNKALRSTGTDLSALAVEYREKLADYDDASGEIFFTPKTEETPEDSVSTPEAETNHGETAPETVEFTDVD